MVSTRKKKSQNKKHLCQLIGTVFDFVIGNGTTVDTMRNEGSELQADGHHEYFGGIVDNASQNQVIGKNTDGRIRHAVEALSLLSKNACTARF